MIELVETKFKEYKENIPQNYDFKSWLAKSNLWGLIYSVFKVQGQVVSKPGVVDLFEGVLREDTPLSCYSFVSAFKEIFKDMQEEHNMQTNPSTKLYKRWAEMFGCNAFRKSNTVIYEIGLIPCHFNSIEESLDAAFKKYNTSKLHPLEASIVLFMDTIKIYPYDEATIDMAFMTLLYCLTRIGYPIPELSLKEEEFNKIISKYMDTDENYQDFYNLFLKCLYNRLDAIVLFEKQALEQER